MQIFSAGSYFTVNYVAYDQDPSLDVLFSIYDITLGPPTLIDTLVANSMGLGAYSAQYQGLAGKTYFVIGAVYTDNTYTTLTMYRPPVCDTYQAQGNGVTFAAFSYGTFDENDSLYLRATIYDVTTGYPVPIRTVNLTDVYAGCYYGTTPVIIGRNYEAVIAVYTDNTYATVDTSRSVSSQSFNGIAFNIIKLVLNNANLQAQCPTGPCCDQPMLVLTQGDGDIAFQLTAVNNGLLVDLTGATFTTFIRGPSGTIVSFPNSQHQANVDQVNFKGQFTLTLSPADTASLAVGVGHEILTAIVISGVTTNFHGFDLLTVLQNTPVI